MLIPYGTDAPIYHFPFATIGVIGTNVAVFAACTIAGPEATKPWILAFGQGMHPMQWVTAIFLHSSLMHLVGNMIFLYSFGLIVEGKVGWWKFLLIYMSVGIVQNLGAQTLMLGAKGGGAMGASGAIFGLLAIAVIWAPSNDFEMVWFLYFRPWFFEVPVMTVGIAYIGWELLWAALSGFAMSSEVLHLLGVAAGAPVGFLLVVQDWVDCEGYDLISVVRGAAGQPRVSRRQRKVAHEKRQQSDRLREQRAESAREQIRVFLQQGNVDAAVRLFDQTKKSGTKYEWSRDQLLLIIRSLWKAQQWDRVAGFMEEYIAKYAEQAAEIKLYLAQLSLAQQGRPARALRLLGDIGPADLSPVQRQLKDRLEGTARKMQADGVIELQDG